MTAGTIFEAGRDTHRNRYRAIRSHPHTSQKHGVSRYLLITGRFHAVTYCLATRTPFVALESNTAKISSLLRDVFGTADRVLQAIDADSFDPEQYSHWSDAEARALDAYLTSARQSTAEMFSAIRAAAHYQPER